MKFRIYEIPNNTIIPFDGIDELFANPSVIPTKVLDGSDKLLKMQLRAWRDTKAGQPIHEGDIVKVIGKKSIGRYATVVVKSCRGYLTLMRNDTYLNDDSALLSVNEVLGNIMQAENEPEDFPDPIDEGRGNSDIVLAYSLDTMEPFTAWFNFNGMCWYRKGKIIPSDGFKWMPWPKVK